MGLSTHICGIAATMLVHRLMLCVHDGVQGMRDIINPRSMGCMHYDNSAESSAGR